MSNESKKPAWDIKKVLKLELSAIFHSVFLQGIGLGTKAEIGLKYRRLFTAVFFPTTEAAQGYIKLEDEIRQKYKDIPKSGPQYTDEWKTRSAAYRGRHALKTVGQLVDLGIIHVVHGNDYDLNSHLAEKSEANLREVLKFLGVPLPPTKDGEPDLAEKKARRALAALNIKP